VMLTGKAASSHLSDIRSANSPRCWKKRAKAGAWTARLLLATFAAAGFDFGRLALAIIVLSLRSEDDPQFLLVSSFVPGQFIFRVSGCRTTARPRA
jgi:hypothetical protein